MKTNRITGTLHDDQNSFFVTSRLVLLEMRNIQTKVVEEITARFFFCLFSNFPLRPPNLAVCEITWKNTVRRGRPPMTIWRVGIACWITRLHRHLEYVIPIAFPLQRWLHERISMLRCTYITCIVFIGDCLKDGNPKLVCRKLKKATAAGPQPPCSQAAMCITRHIFSKAVSLLSAKHSVDGQ